jgi:hypothetical protein
MWEIAIISRWSTIKRRRGSERGRKSFFKTIGIFASGCVCSLRFLFPEARTRDGGSGLLVACAPPCLSRLENDSSRMLTLPLMIAELYGVEKLARQRGLRGEELRLLREQGARPVLHKIHGYLLQIREELLPKSEAGQAANYILKNWIALTRYCEHADLSIDNNQTERSLRGWAVGRNNWTNCCPIAGLLWPKTIV